MPADLVLARELQTLQGEVAAARRQPPPSAAASAAPAAVSAVAPEEAEERALRDQLGELVDQVTQFFADAEKNIAAHPAESVVGALLVGILIGRLLGRG